jgi:predicted nuclease of restriction endonuclease-like (RecB) superfamily
VISSLWYVVHTDAYFRAGTNRYIGEKERWGIADNRRNADDVFHTGLLHLRSLELQAAGVKMSKQHMLEQDMDEEANKLDNLGLSFGAGT